MVVGAPPHYPSLSSGQLRLISFRLSFEWLMLQRSDITVPPPPACPDASIGPAKSWVYGRDPGCCTSNSFRGTGMTCNVTCAQVECAKAKMVWRPENTSVHPYECCHAAVEA